MSDGTSASAKGAHDEDRVAVKLLNSVSREWGLSKTESCNLAGCSEQQLDSWVKSLAEHESVALPRSTKMRLSHLAGIYKWFLLNGFYSHQGAVWLRQENTHLKARKPIDYLVSDDVADLVILKRHLQSWYETPYF